MKSTKTMFYAAIVAIAVTIAGCKKDKDESVNQASIVGKWQFKKDVQVKNGKTTIDEDWESFNWVQFNDNNTYKASGMPIPGTDGTYTLLNNGKQVQVTFSGFKTTYDVKSVTSNSMVLYEEYIDDSDKTKESHEYTFAK